MTDVKLPDLRHKTTLLHNLHCWCIQKVVGQKVVIMNVDLRITPLKGWHIKTSDLYVDNCTLPSGLEIRSHS